MTYTFKLARRLARFRTGGLLATLFLLACGAGDDPIGPDTDTSLDPATLTISPDSVTVGVDGAVQFEASPGETASYRYGSWWSHRRLVSLSVSPDPTQVSPGGRVSFTASGRTSSGSSVRPWVRWSATGGTIDENGRYVAGRTAGRYLVIAKSSSGMADTARVAVTTATDPADPEDPTTPPDGTPASLVLSPGTAALTTGQRQQFSVTAKAQDGSALSVSPRYTATGGTISSTGSYTAGENPGTYRVIASDQSSGLADTSTVTIGITPVASVTVTPSTADLAVGATTQLEAQVRDESGSTISSAAVAWSSSDPDVATVNASGLVRGVSAGQATIRASSGGKQDDATVTVASDTPPPAPGSGGTFANCDGLPSASRTVNVSSPSALSSALSNARPGDRIVLAPGTYSGGKRITSRSGTQSAPIVLCGPKSAVLTGDLRLEGANWWVFQGFTLRDAFQAFHAKRSSYNRLQGLEIYNVGQEAIHFLCNSSENVIQANWIHDTGTGSRPEWGEAVYLGTWPSNASSHCGSSAADRSDRNRVIQNRFGPNVRSEDVDAKENTAGGIIQGNVSDGSGKRSISGNFQSSIALKGSSSGYQVTDNVINGAAATSGGTVGDGINALGSNHTFRRNRITMGNATGYGIRVSGSGHLISCDNVVDPASRRSNVSCQ